jgi:hypothetical protein
MKSAQYVGISNEIAGFRGTQFGIQWLTAPLLPFSIIQCKLLRFFSRVNTELSRCPNRKSEIILSGEEVNELETRKHSSDEVPESKNLT